VELFDDYQGHNVTQAFKEPNGNDTRAVDADRAVGLGHRRSACRSCRTTRRPRGGAWKELQHAIFGDRRIGWRRMDRYRCAASCTRRRLVPVNLTLKGDKPIKSVYLVIDANPGPLAAILCSTAGRSACVSSGCA